METIKSSLVHRLGPLNTSQKGSHPALILLHGRGADENDLLGLASHLDPRFFVISVRAPFPFEQGGYTWYTVLEVGKPEPREFKESYERLAQFLEDIKREYPVDSGRVFLLGFSMGTMMSFSLALTKPQSIRGVVAHSGYIPEDTGLVFRMNELADTSFFVAHGLHDPVIPVQFSRRAKEILDSAKADVTYKEYPIGHQISDESLHDISEWLKTQIDSGNP